MPNPITASVYAFYPKELPLGGRPVWESAAKIVEAGFGLETWLSGPGFRPYNADEIDRLGEVCRAASTVTAHTSTYTWDPDSLKAEIGLCAKLGARVLVVHPGTFGFEKCDNPPSLSVLADLCKCALDSGLLLAYENGGRTGMEMMMRGAELVGDGPEVSGLGICIDTGHANRSAHLDGFPAEAYIERFADSIIEIHINDNLGAEDLHLPPGEGTIDWPSVFSAAKKLRKDAILCLELAGQSGTDPLIALSDARSFVEIRLAAAKSRKGV